MAAPSITNALRLRKTLTLFRRIHLPAAPTIAASHSVLHSGVAAAASRPAVLFDGGVQGFMLLRRAAFSSDRFAGESEEIGPDTILFEGCDYNHWLITMDFPKDAKLSPEEMVKTYEETCAKGLGISIEEAKKRMYACSTTTYQGFQAIMTEEESEKFKGIPGVVFILPDSYIDPVNKEYGGDKYENGVITHRPPPVQYRREGGRFRDRNRNPDQPSFDRQGVSMPNRPQNYGPPGYQQNSGPAQNYVPQQNYGSPGSAQNYPPQQGFGQHGQPGAHRTNYAPQQSFSQPGGPNGYPPQPNYGSQGAPQNYPPPQNYGQQGAPNSYSAQQNYAPPLGGRDPYQPQTRDSVPPPRVDQNQFNSGTQGIYSPAGQGYSGANNGNYSPANDGHFGQQNYYQGTEQGYPGETRRNPQMNQGNAEDQQKNYMPVGHSGINQGRY